MGQPQPQSPPFVTLADFYALDWGDDIRRELHDGQVVAMAPPKNAHGTIVINLGAALKAALRGRRPCRVQTEAGIIPPSREHSYYQADLLVTCEPSRPGERDVQAPLFICEVLSESTELFDRRCKIPEYRALASVRELLLVDSERMFVELHRRIDERRWLTEILQRPSDHLALETADLTLTLTELYEDVALGPANLELPL
ncbi:Uma2 family endonuclease [Nannocystis radixulma]|uniref:Uma2 family endonuclease n=1 Tax=Nannocystis radixulma TaxID=2995305 RepID=A0ABT5B217_9BACT|nr:Uma2 family endonuclease [Nannocystis radixulma]MDC0667574.1 Uma2 family endonuclease [Nannocystis radixulma]